MDIVAEPSRGLNIVAEPKALAPYFPVPTVDAAYVEVFWQEVDAATGALLGVPNSLGRMPRGAAGSFQYTPVADKTVRLFALPYNAFGVPAVDELEDATSHDIDFSAAATAPALDSVDAGVPIVTIAPTVTKVDFQEQWSVYYPNPDSLGYSLVDSDVQLRRASDQFVLFTRPNGRTNNTTISQQAFDCLIRYRWRNQYREGGSDGWSDWSPDAPAYGLGSAAANTPEGELDTFDQDPNDIFNPGNRDTLYNL